MKNVCGIILILPAILITLVVAGQPGTYILNGSAVQNTCNCYTLTGEVNFQSGSVWNASKISLNDPFDFVFNVFLGCKDADGADGIVFILQPISTSIGTAGGGMGFQGIAPSIGIALDTWQNTDLNDPVFDHISIQANGNSTHGSDLAGPVQASANSANIEDCQWHTFRISWDPVTHLLRTYFDGQFRLEATIDLVANIFNNDPMVFWGFSAATGGSNNRQQFCTALNPGFSANTTANGVCLGTPVVFTNISESFAPITSYYWDFGDGTTSTLPSPPSHLYSSPGSYNVKLAITGLDGCFSDTLQRTVYVGDFPVAGFEVTDTCAGSPPRINDLSTVAVGNINNWTWSLYGNQVSSAATPNLQLAGLPAGPYELELTVTSIFGCTSQPVMETFLIIPRPQIEATGDNGCADLPVLFSGNQLDNATFITQWNWQFGDGQGSTMQNPQHIYANTGTYAVQVNALADNGCPSTTISIPVVINRAIANAGNDTLVIKDTPFQLQGSGGVLYNWSPAVGLNNPQIANPQAVLQDDITYTLTVTTPEGCTDTDEISVTVFKGAAVYVPTGFTPNNDGLNDLLRPYMPGIQKLEYFTVYNRWGQIVFTSKTIGEGWNGWYKGGQQPSGSYVWTLKAVDFAGKVYQLSGTTTLIR